MNKPIPNPDDLPILEEHLGCLVFVRRWVGSKSERFSPSLVKAEGQILWLKHAEDSSFDPAHLRPFHLQHVRVAGHVSSDGYLIVEEVDLAKDPFHTP